MTLGEQLKQLRQNKGWTQPEAAAKIGIEQSYLSKLENDKSVPSADLFNSLMEGFQIDVASLVEPLSPKQQNYLRNIPAVADYFKLVQQQQAKHSRSWLLAALASFIIGIFGLAAGYFNVFAPAEVHYYQSEGVTNPGESPAHFQDWKQQVHFLSREDYQKLSKEMYLRKDPQTVTKAEFVGEHFIQELDQGVRYFRYEGPYQTESRLSLLLMALGITLAATAVFCLYLARRWR